MPNIIIQANTKEALDSLLASNGLLNSGEGVGLAPGVSYSYIGKATLDETGVLLPLVYGSLRINESIFGESKAASVLLSLQSHTYNGAAPRMWLGEGAYDPKSQVPYSVTPRQARLALLAAGKLTAVESAINTLPEPQRSAAKIVWEYSTEIHRNNGLVPQMATALGMTEKQIDDLFIAAVQL